MFYVRGFVDAFRQPKVHTRNTKPLAAVGLSRFDHRQPRRVISGVHLKIEKGENICNSTK